MLIDGQAAVTDPQAESVVRLAQASPKRIWDIMIELPGKTVKNITKDKLGYLKKYLLSEIDSTYLQANKQKGFVKTAKTNIDDFLSEEESLLDKP